MAPEVADLTETPDGLRVLIRQSRGQSVACHLNNANPTFATRP
jgi:hypothetical protein